MKKYMILKFFVIALLIVTCKEKNVGSITKKNNGRQIDTTLLGGIDSTHLRSIDSMRFKKIVYSPLTAREGRGLTLPVPPAEHPRLFFRKSDIPKIKENGTHSLLQSSWNRVVQNAGFSTDGRLRQGVANNFNIYSRSEMQIIDAIEARAFLYALNGDREKGIEAVDFIFNLHNTLIIDHRNSYLASENIGRIILATSVVYDWCYDLIAAAEKQSLIKIMESLATNLEVRWPQLPMGSVVGHGPEFQLLRDLLSLGIAVYDENPEIYRRVAGRIFAEVIPAQNYRYQSGHHDQGSFYGPYRFLWEMYPTLIFDRMGYSDLKRPLQGKMPYYWMYIRRPDGQLFCDGDGAGESRSFRQYWNFDLALAYTASYYKDPLLMGETIRQRTIGQTPLYDLLLFDPNIQIDNNLAALPLTRYFPSPFGGMVARTGWDTVVSLTSATVVAEMRIVERYFSNHQHLDAGSFQIYYKGPLAINSGIYGGTEGEYGSSHFLNYYQRSIAHNSMLIYNPAERFTWHGNAVSNDGGQRFPANAAEPLNLNELMRDDYITGKVLAHDFGPDPIKPEYSYLKGDITRSYTNKVRNHQRAFVFLDFDNPQIPAALIVHDYVVSSNANFKKTWLLHCVQEPTFDGNVTTIVRNEKGYNGKLVNTTLLPLSSNTHLAKIGGAGKEFSVGGINYAQYLSNPSNNAWDGAIWRVELSSKAASETDVFLNVMQVTDANNNRLLSVEAIETTALTGTQIADRIVMFSKNGNLVNTTIDLTITGSGTFKTLLTDLENGNWTVSGGIGTIVSANNLIYFEATAGNYVITRR